MNAIVYIAQSTMFQNIKNSCEIDQRCCNEISIHKAASSMVAYTVATMLLLKIAWCSDGINLAELPVKAWF